MFDVGQTSKDLAARGIHSDAEGRYWHKDIRRAFPPKGRGRPRTKGIVVRQHSKGKIDAELPGRAQALARFILHNDPVRRELVAEHYAREIRNQPNVIYPEKSYGFARVYRLALEEAMREAAFYDELEGGTAWQDHVAAWNRFRSRSKISKAD